MPPTGDDPRATGASDVPDPYVDQAFREQVDRVDIEKHEAEQAADIPWGEWWFHSGSKWYIGLGFFIADVWVVAYAYQSGIYVLAVALLGAAVYGEYVLYQYLYHQPDDDGPHVTKQFRPTWVHPFRFGRWTEGGAILRAGGNVPVTERGPDPKDFL